MDATVTDYLTRTILFAILGNTANFGLPAV